MVRITDATFKTQPHLRSSASTAKASERVTLTDMLHGREPYAASTSRQFRGLEYSVIAVQYHLWSGMKSAVI